MPISASKAMQRMQHIVACTLVFACVYVQAQPFGFVVNSDGVDASMAPDTLYQINLATGEAVSIGATGFQDIEALAIDASGQLYGVDDASNTLLRMDTFSGSGIPVSGSENNLGLNATTSFDFGLTFVCGSQQPLLTSDTSNQIFQLDLDDNGRAQEIGSFADVSLTGLASAVIDGEFRIYGLGAGNINRGLYRVDAETLTASMIGTLSAASDYNDGGLAFDADGNLWAITDRTAVNGQISGSEILRIDIDTGTATLITEIFTGVESLAITALDCSGINDDDDGDGDVGDPDGDTEAEPEAVPVLNMPALFILLVITLMLAGRRLSQANK